MNDHEEWLRDADSCYLAARGLGLMMPRHLAVFDGFVLLAHHALERYLKGILSAFDSKKFNPDYLRKTFGHDLSLLLQEASKVAPKLDTPPVWDACEILTREWMHARYLVTADASKVHPAATQLDLARMDEIVALVRSEFVAMLSPAESAGSILSQLSRVGVPFAQQREILVQQNLSLSKFQGL